MERALRRSVLIVEDDIESWYPWHCENEKCKHHMCRVRKEKLKYLKELHKELYLRWRTVKAGLCI